VYGIETTGEERSRFGGALCRAVDLLSEY